MQFTVAMMSQKSQQQRNRLSITLQKKPSKLSTQTEDGKVSALEFVAPFAVGASGLGILSNVNTLANTLGITDKNIVNEIISSVEDGH
jgi:hypothetical protein